MSTSKLGIRRTSPVRIFLGAQIATSGGIASRVAEQNSL